MKHIIKIIMVCSLSLISITGISADPYRLSPDYRPVTIAIFWAEWEAEQEHTQYEYNTRGQLVKTSVFRGRENPSWYTTYEYDKQNKLIRMSTYSETELSRYSVYTYYDNKLYEEAERDQKGNYKKIEQYEYNDKGDIFSIAGRETPYNGTTLSWKTLEIYSYNKDQRIDNKLEYYDGTLHNKSIFEYKPDSLVITTSYFGDLRNISSKAIKIFSYNSDGEYKDKLGEISYNYINYADGKEYIECCTTYSMRPAYDVNGNMTTLSYFNCEQESAGKAVITWEKKKTDVKMIIKVFDQLHWYFTGC